MLCKWAPLLRSDPGIAGAESLDVSQPFVMPLDHAIRSLFRAPFFSVDFDALGGHVITRELGANDQFQIGDITVSLEAADAA